MECGDYIKLLEEQNDRLLDEINILRTQINDGNSCVINKVDDISMHKYSILEKFRSCYKIGKGTFGKVWLVKDKNDKKRALKRVLISTQHQNREYQNCCWLMKHQHDSIIHIYHAWMENSELNILMTHIKNSLCEILTNLNNRKLLMHEKVHQILTRQLASALQFLHQHNFCHRDLKPQNILIETSSRKLYVCDFGCSKFLSKDIRESNETYICSRYYRAPELIVDRNMYTCAIDIWSFGCIFVECCTGIILFMGEDNVSMLIEQMKVIGSLSLKDLKTMQTAQSYSDEFPIIKDLPSNWHTLFSVRTLGVYYETLCMNVLCFNIEKRWDADKILNAEYFCINNGEA